MRRVAAAPRSPGESDQRPDRSASERSVSLAARGDIHSAVIGTQAGLIGEFGGPAIVNVTLSTRSIAPARLAQGLPIRCCWTRRRRSRSYTRARYGAAISDISPALAPPCFASWYAPRRPI